MAAISLSDLNLLSKIVLTSSKLMMRLSLKMVSSTLLYKKIFHTNLNFNSKISFIYVYIFKAKQMYSVCSRQFEINLVSSSSKLLEKGPYRPQPKDEPP